MIYGTVPCEEAPKKSDIISRVASSPLNILADTFHEGYFSCLTTSILHVARLNGLYR